MGAVVRVLDLCVFGLAAAVFNLAFSAEPVFAEVPMATALTVPQGTPILTVSGQIDPSIGSEVAVFDLEGLQKLGVSTYETTTIWTTGTQTFEGVTLSSLLAAVGAKGSAIRATALNDYAIEIPMKEALDSSALLAFRMNGASLSTRDKGPIWVVYPYDSSKDFQTEVVYSRSIWQLDRIEVLP